MRASWQAAGRWLAVGLTVLLTSYLLLGLTFGGSLFLNAEFAGLSRLFPRVAPAVLVSLAKRIDLFVDIVIWVVPVALAMGSALRRKWSSSLRWGAAVSITLAAVLFWLLSQYDSAVWVRMAASLAIFLLAGERVSFSRKLILGASSSLLQGIALLVLFLPFIRPVVHSENMPPAAHKVWSVVLQRGTWQAMNTGSGGTRQMVFAGDRILVVFDAGSAPYEGNEAMSRYRLLSLDSSTGAVKNQMEFVGH